MEKKRRKDPINGPKPNPYYVKDIDNALRCNFASPWSHQRTGKRPLLKQDRKETHLKNASEDKGLTQKSTLFNLHLNLSEQSRWCANVVQMLQQEKDADQPS